MNHWDNLDPMEKDILLEHFFYSMDQSARQDIMARYPHIYNQVCGSKFVQVVHTSDPEWQANPKGQQIT